MGLGSVKKFDWLVLYMPFQNLRHSNVLYSLKYFSTNLRMLSVAEGYICGLQTPVQSTLVYQSAQRVDFQNQWHIAVIHGVDTALRLRTFISHDWKD